MTKQAARSTTGRGIQGSDPHTSSRVPVQRKKRIRMQYAHQHQIFLSLLTSYTAGHMLQSFVVPSLFNNCCPSILCIPKQVCVPGLLQLRFLQASSCCFPLPLLPAISSWADALPYTCPANSQVFEKSFVHARRPFVTNALLTRARSPRQPSRTANPPYQMSLLIVGKRETKRESACARERDRDIARA